jgi:Tfp pilus assembly protein PilF
MDCRKPLLGLALALLGAVAGCHLPAGGAVTTVKKPPEDTVVQKAPTFVAFGDFRAKSGFAPEIPPDKQQQYRVEARLAYEKALEIDPKHLPAHVSLARLHAAVGDNSQAIVTYEKALDLSGADKDGSLWYELGVCQCRMKDWGKAADAFKKASEREPSNRHYANALGYSLARGDRLGASLECLARVYGQAKAHYYLARVLHHMDKNELARQQATLAINEAPDLKAARDFLEELDRPAAGASSPAIQTVAHTEVGPDAPTPQIVTAPGASLALPPLPVISGEMRQRKGNEE